MQNIRWRKPQLESASEADIIGMSPLAMKASQMVLGTRNNTKACSTASDPLHIDSWRVQSLMYHHAMVASQLERGKYNKSCTEALLADGVADEPQAADEFHENTSDVCQSTPPSINIIVKLPELPDDECVRDGSNYVMDDTPPNAFLHLASNCNAACHGCLLR